MGFLMLAGLLGSIAYSGHVIKNDLKAETIDYQTKPTFDVNQNKKQIKNNFNMICTRAGIKTDNSGNPIHIDQCHKGMEYLQYQGYGEEEVEEFKNIYTEKYDRGKNSKKKAIIEENKQLMKYLRNQTSDELVVIRKRVYKCDTPPEERMSKLLQNNLWSKIVYHHTYIRSDVGKFEEIWTLKVPKNFFKQISKNKLYNNICYLQGVYNGF